MLYLRIFSIIQNSCVFRLTLLIILYIKLIILNVIFLERVFTPHIINGLNRRNLLKEQYLSFLINEHLKKLDFEDFQECPLEAILERVSLIGSVSQVLL